MVIRKTIRKKSNIYVWGNNKNYAFLIQGAKLENLEFAISKNWLARNNFELAADENFRNLMEHANLENLKKYTEKSLMDFSNPFFYQNYQALEKLENSQILNIEDQNQISNILDLIARNNGTLTPTLAKKWLELTTETGKEQLLEGFKKLQRQILYARTDEEINYNDQLVLEAIQSLLWYKS